MRRPHAAAATALAVLLLLLLLCLAVALIHGNGLARSRRPTTTRWPAVPRKMLLAMTSFDAAASPSSTGHHHHHHHHLQHHHHHRNADRRWNRHGVIPSLPPSAAGEGDEAIDPRYGVQKRLVPSGPNPLHH
ncbi:inactive protein FON2 SPARE1-like [Miscanthus floridulus]|uniref:inactive protein FON2 SPARE1-like n=1 Tax=Miscanthus floridulus TaxID=154761 RepID=UPI00345B4B47